MTSAKNDARALLAERFGEELVPLDEVQPDAGQATSRARFIALLHALIAWFLDHPEIPVPRSLQLHAYVVDVDALEQLAAAHDATTYGTLQRQFDLQLAELDTGTLASLLVAVERGDRPL